MVEENESKLLFDIFFFYILFNLMTIIICSSYIYDLNLMNMVSFQLYNQNLLLFTNKGFYTVDENLTIINNYTESFNFSIESKSNYPFFTQFSQDEGGIVLCLILKTLYIFDENGHFKNSICINELPNIENSALNCIINAFKKEVIDYFYIIICNNYQNYMDIFYYKINENGNNSLISNNFYKNENETMLQTGSITCQKIKDDDKKYITCFYQYQSITNRLYISEITFDPDNNFTYFEPKKNFLNNIGNEEFYFACSLSNEDRTKIYICYRTDNDKVKCFNFDTKKKEFSNIYSFDTACGRTFYSFNLNYFKKTNELIFSCSYNQDLSFIKFNEDMNYFGTNTTNTNDFISIDSILILYSINYQNYIFFLNAQPKINGNNYTVIRYEIPEFDDILSPESETKKISDLITATLVQSTQLSKVDEINYSSDITELTQNSESNKLTISTEIYHLDSITNIVSDEITSSTDITKEKSFESISTQIMTSIQLTDKKLTNKLTEFPKVITESIKSSEIIEKSTEITVKTHEVDHCKDNGMKTNEQGECVCNNEKGYYPIFTNNINNIYENKCYNNDTKPHNFYFK